MHELSIAISMVEMASAEAAQRGAQINAVHLRLGPLSGVVKEALLFSWDIACADTPLAGARLVVEEVPVAVFCDTCQAEQVLAELPYLRCPFAPRLRQTFDAAKSCSSRPWKSQEQNHYECTSFDRSQSQCAQAK